jgi:hypothetical protein
VSEHQLDWALEQVLVELGVTRAGVGAIVGLGIGRGVGAMVGLGVRAGAGGGVTGAGV